MRDKLMLLIKIKEDTIKAIESELIELRREFDKVRYKRVLLFKDNSYVDLNNLDGEYKMDNGQLFRRAGEGVYFRVYDEDIVKVFDDLEELKFYFYNQEMRRLVK